jgi:arylsulfatase
VLTDAASVVDGEESPLRRMGGITEIATGEPGYSSVLPNTMSPLARTLKLNGYSTAQFGKCHEVPVWETSPVGPVRRVARPGGGGFEYFYGFIGGEANQWYPTLYEGTTAVEPKTTPETATTSSKT